MTFQKELTKEQQCISYRNRENTRKLLNVPKGYVLHHKDETLRHKNIERYIQWNPDDLIVMTASEHAKLHMQSNLQNHICNYGNKKGKPNTWYRKKCMCVETNEIFSTISEASLKYPIGNISRACKNKDYTANGYHWVLV